MYYGNYDQNGKYIGFFLTEIHGDNIPTPNIELTEQQWQQALTGDWQVINGQHTYVPLPEPSPKEIRVTAINQEMQQIDSKLDQIDRRSIRALRSIVKGTDTEADRVYLEKCEQDAAELRLEREELVEELNELQSEV